MSEDRRRRHLALSTLAAGGLLRLAGSAGAQGVAPRDSLPARAGTYALEGAVGVNSTSLGALRFFSPRSALGATLTADYARQSGDNSSSRNGGFGLSLGYRRYGRVRDGVAVFGTAGLTGAYSHYSQAQTQATQQGTYTSSQHSDYSSVGAFGELGASYLVVRRLAVNASAQASVSNTFARIRSEQTSPSGTSVNTGRQDGVRAALGPVRLGLTLFL